MPTTGNQVAVGVTAVPVNAPQAHAQIMICRDAGTTSVFLGDNIVTASGANAGFELPASTQTPPMTLDPQEVLFGVSASGTNRLDVLQLYSA